MTQQYNTDLPSGRIRFALASLAEFEREDGCEVDMRKFFSVDDDRRCLACFGGAAALYYGEIPKEDWFNPYDPVSFGQELFDFADSLDDARMGNIAHMFVTMGLTNSEGMDFDRIITDYRSSSQKFKGEMQQLADDIEAAGY